MYSKPFPSITLPPGYTSLTTYLMGDGLLTTEDAENILKAIHQQTFTLTQYLVKKNLLSSEFIFNYCKKKFALPTFDMNHFDPAWIEEGLIKIELIHRYRIVPLNRDQKYLYLAITDPTDHVALTVIGFHTGLCIRPMLVAEDELTRILNKYFNLTDLNSKLESTLSKIPIIDQPEWFEKEKTQDEEPVTEFVDQLIHNAITNQVSDIHIEPYEQACRIRFRLDGLLSETAILPIHLANRIILRLKIMANLNIAERRLPQDGRIRLESDTKIDLRINTCPTLCGEKIVLRILDTKNITLDINNLGLNAAQKKLFLHSLNQPQGLILVTGPTGSGKTITLYSALHYLNQIEKNISTVEDPVEIELKGIAQVPINTKIGLDFSSVLRTFLRQDPDIIMVGEIRDLDTAAIAIQAAQTGHLVLSTLHTNSAAETMIRLQSMGLAAYNLIHSISLIIAQRLVRKLCLHCKQPEILPTEWHDQPSTPCITYRAIGCEHCHHGYLGRIGIFEVIPMTENIAQIILKQNDLSAISEQMQHSNWPSLWQAGWEKVRAGITSVAEITRVLGKR